MQRGLHVAMTPSATPLVTPSALRRLHTAGLSRLALSLDGKDAETHDAFRRVPGSFQRTLDILADARDVGLSLQVNTTVTRRNQFQLDAIADLLASRAIALWSVFFLVPVGRGLDEQRLRPDEYEQAFATLWRQARRQPYAIKTTEAPHYRRYMLQHQPDGPNPVPQGSSDLMQRAPLGINDGRGVVFVSHTGAVYPSGFMPLECGRFPRQSVVDIYRDSPLLRQLRQPDGFSGKCAQCEFRRVCGGSRARAFAVTGNPLASEPDCTYLPKALAHAGP